MSTFININCYHCSPLCLSLLIFCIYLSLFVTKNFCFLKMYAMAFDIEILIAVNSL